MRKSKAERVVAQMMDALHLGILHSESISWSWFDVKLKRHRLRIQTFFDELGEFSPDSVDDFCDALRGLMLDLIESAPHNLNRRDLRWILFQSLNLLYDHDGKAKEIPAVESNGRFVVNLQGDVLSDLNEKYLEIERRAYG